MFNNVSILARVIVLPLVLSDAPHMSNLQRVRENLTSPFHHEVSLDCPLSTGSELKFTWYRNGHDITGSCNQSTGYLIYYTTEEDSTSGIYQCFARNDVGSDSAIVRVLNGGM